MIAQLEIFPLGTGRAGVSAYVARAVKLIQASGLPYRVGAMGTTIEGEWDAVMRVVKRCHHAMLRQTGRVMTMITIDDRVDTSAKRAPRTALRMEQKLRSLEAKLGRRLAS